MISIVCSDAFDISISISRLSIICDISISVLPIRSTNACVLLVYYFELNFRILTLVSKFFIIILWLAIYWFNFEISLISRFVTIYSLTYKNIKPLINILSIEITGLLIQIVRLRSISTRNIRTHLRFSDNESATHN